MKGLHWLCCLMPARCPCPLCLMPAHCRAPPAPCGLQPLCSNPLHPAHSERWRHELDTGMSPSSRAALLLASRAKTRRLAYLLAVGAHAHVPLCTAIMVRWALELRVACLASVRACARCERARN